MQQATLVIVTASVKKTMRALVIMCSGAQTLKMLESNLDEGACSAVSKPS